MYTQLFLAALYLAMGSLIGHVTLGFLTEIWFWVAYYQ